MEYIIETWMTIVGLIMAIAGIPQVLRLRKRKSSGDLSIWLFLLVGFGQFWWLLYGIYRSSISLILTNALCLSVCSLTVFLCLSYRKPACPIPMNLSAPGGRE